VSTPAENVDAVEEVAVEPSVTEEQTITEEVGEVEIVVDGEEEPTSQVRIPRSTRRLKRKNERLENEKSEVERRNESLEAENRALRQAALGVTNEDPNLEPQPEDFIDDLEWRKKHAEWRKEQQAQVAREVVQGVLKDAQAKTVERQQQAAVDRQLDEHYERVEELGASDYEATEEKAISYLGVDLLRTIAANFDKSALLIYHLGKNRSAAEDLRRQIEANPVKGIRAIDDLEGRLSVKAKANDTPDPSGGTLKGGSTPSNQSQWQARIDKEREDFGAGKEGVSIHTINALKKEAEEAGVTVF